MLKTYKFLSVITIFFALGLTTTQAQTDPHFTITWDSCTLSTEHSTYEINYSIIQVPGSTPVTIPAVVTVTRPEDIYSLPVEIYYWSCDQSTEKYYYYIYITVEKKDYYGITYCSGQLTVGPLRCSELYEGNTYNVIMN